MPVTKTTTTAHEGDWIETRGLHGEPARRGQIVAVIGEGRHERYRVRWDDEHESIVYPADGVIISARSAR